MTEEGAGFITGYVVVETVCESSNEAIYRAVRESSGERVLIKKYYPSLVWSDSHLNEFFNLVGYLRFIEHEYILPVLDFGKQEGVPYVVFADDSLVLLTERQVAKPGPNEALDFLYKIAEVLDLLHKQEILHGALGIENTFVDAQGNPRLCDFGLSGTFKKVLLDNMEDGFDNLSVSNLNCASPEQIQGLNPTRASDIYAFGVIAYYYLFDSLPFDKGTVSETALAHLVRGAAQVVKFPKSIPVRLIDFVQKCLQLDPDSRFASFSQILKILDRMKRNRWVRFTFEKRFVNETVVQNLRIIRWSLRGLIVLSVLAASFYFFAPPLIKPPVTTTVTQSPSTEETAQPSAQTQSPAVTDAPTQSEAPQANTPVVLPPSPGTVYKPFIEGKQPSFSGQVIAIANLSSLREVSRLGYGKPEDVDISAAGGEIAVAASGGVYIFRGTQLSVWLDAGDWVTSVRFSPDGSLLAVGLNKGDIQLWDWRNEIKTDTLEGHSQRVNRIVFREGRLYSASADRSVIVWNLNTRKYSSIQVHSMPVNDMVVTADGRTIVTASDDHWIRVWDAASGNKLYEFCFDSQQGVVISAIDSRCSNVKALALSSDDVYLAAGGETGFVRQWVFSRSRPPDGSLLNRTDSIPVGKMIWSLRYTRNDSELLVGTYDGENVSYVSSRMEYEGAFRDFEVETPPKDLVDVFGSTFDFDTTAVSSADAVLQINWDGKVTYQQNQIVSPMYDILDRLDFSPDGTILAAGGRRGSTDVWNLTTNQFLYKNLYALPFGDSISPDGSSIAIIVEEIIPIAFSNQTLKGFRYESIDLTSANLGRVTPLSQTVKDGWAGYARNGEVFIAGSLNDSRTWDFHSAYETWSHGYQYRGGCRVTVSDNDGEELQIVSAAGVFRSRDAKYEERLCALLSSHSGYLSAFSKDLHLLAYVTSGRALEAENLSSNGTWRHVPERTVTITALAVSPDGSLVAYGDDAGNMIILDGRNGDRVGQLVGNFGAVYAIEFSEDGTKIATAGQDGLVRVFGIVETK